MHRLTRVALACCVLSCVASAQVNPASQTTAAKKRVAILDFDFATVQNYVAAIFGSNQDVGKGIADLLVDRLVTDGRYSVIERKAVDKILAEQNFSNSNRADSTTAAKLGKMLGVDAIIIGSVTQFGRDDQNRSIGGGAFGGLGSKYGLGGVGRTKSKAVVAVSARIVSVDTGEILGVASGKGESTRSGTSLLGSGGHWSGGGAGAVNMGSSEFGETILGEAVQAAVSQVATGLEDNASKLPTKSVTLNGLVADVSGKTLIINIGSAAGVHLGDRLAVRSPVREIKDPGTGKVLKRIEQTVGELTITQVDAGSATGEFSGTGSPKVGDAVGNTD